MMRTHYFALLPLLFACIIVVRDGTVAAKRLETYGDDHVNKTKLVVTIKHKKPSGTGKEKTKEENDEQENERVFSDGGKIDILTTEGEPGWLEKVLKKAKAKSKSTKESSTEETTENPSKKTVDTSQAPTAAISSVESSLDELGSTGKRAKTGLGKLVANWKEKPVNERAFITNALWSITANIGAFANAKENPMGAVVGAVNIASSFAATFGPKGMIISGGISFISGILSLFGKGPKQKSVGEVVREQIDEALNEFYDQSLSDEAQGAIKAMQHSKSFLDGVASSGNMISDGEAKSLSAHVPVYRGITFMAKLGTIIRRIVEENRAKDAKKCLRYIELYTTIGVLKDITLQQSAALLPDSHKNIRAGINGVLESLRDAQTDLFEFLYKSDLGNKIMPYFDPDVSMVTDAYLDKVLNIPNYSRWLAGTYCFTPGRQKVSMTFSTAVKKFAKNRPYATLARGNNCFWKVVPHGNWLFSIVNKKNCPKDRYCGALLSFDGIGGGRARVTIDHEDPILWEIAGNQQKRIRSKYGCNSDPPSEYCNKELGMGYEVYYTYGFRDAFMMMRPRPVKVLTGQLVNSYGGYVWWLSKSPVG